MNRVFRVIWNEALSSWTAVPELARSPGRSASVVCAAPLLFGALFAASLPASAACSGGAVIVCDNAGVHGTTVGAGPVGPAGTSVELLPGAQVDTGDAPAISVGDNAAILLRGGSIAGNAAAVNLGNYGTGANTIEFNSGTTLTIEAGAQVRSTGTQWEGEAVNAMGSGNRIVNSGTISADNADATLWLEATSGSNTIVNTATGVIYGSGANGEILGVSGTMAVDFTNQGSLVGNLSFADGNDILRWSTGATITGVIAAGGGANLLILNGAGTDTFSQTISGFQSLEKQDTGTWTLNISLPGSGITSTLVREGTLILGTDASGYTGSMGVLAPGILQSSAQFAPLAITNDGLVRFAQPTDASYAGLITGLGGIEKTGAGRLTLLQDQAFTGTTTISAGILQLGNGGTSGTVLGDIVDNAALEIDRSNALTLGGLVSGSGTLSQNGSGTTILTADNLYSGGTVINAGTLQLGNGGASGSIVGDVLNNGALVFNRSDASVLAGAISGNGTVSQVGSGITTLAGGNSYGGATTVAAGTLRAGAANTFSPNSAHSVAAGATLDLAGFSQTLASLSNSGTVSLLGATPGTTLTVNGPYLGNNALLRIGTALGDSSSASDRLILNGPAAAAGGNTRIQVTNLGGLGAQTTGNGIEVVTALNGATSTAQTTKSAFALAGNGHVDAGAFEYRLYAADAGGAGENWYLRSSTTVTLPVPVRPAPSSAAAQEPAQEPAPTAVLISLPTYRAEVPLLAAMPAQLRQGSLAMLGNLHRRIGDEDPGGPGAAGVPRRAWARVIGADIDIRQNGIASPRSEGRLKGLQAGTDLWADANWRAGVYVGRLEGDIDVSGFARGAFGRVGHNDLRSDYLGGYATYTHASGFYADAVLQAGRHRYSVLPLANLPASGKADSRLASIEVGQSFPIGERWKIEPQLQLVHQRQRLDDVAIGGARVSQQADDGWLVRAGVRIKGEIATEAGTLQPYARVNYYRGSGGNDVARFLGPAASTDIASGTGHSTAEVAAGATLTLNPTASLYGEVGKLFALGGDARLNSGVQGSVGLRVRW
jgi:outer membrane autotransporter protein